MTTSARPDLKAFDHAMRLQPVAACVSELIDLLGPRLVAYIGGVKETRAVKGWADGSEIKDPAIEKRLRHALYIATFIADVETRHAAQAWIQGLNPQLNDRAPARLLREGDIDEVIPDIAAAARGFIIGG